MNKTFLIFKHEFLYKIKSVSFIIVTLVIPVLALLSIGIFKLVSTLVESPAEEIKTIGYVDEIGTFTDHTDQGSTKLVAFASREGANRALLKSDITEYIIIPQDYTSTGTIQRYTLEEEFITPPVTTAIIKNFLTGNLLKDEVPPDTVTLIVSPLNLEVTRVTEQGDIALEQSNINNIIIPGVFSLLLCLSFMFGTTSLINGLGEEKESRLIEVLFSSVSIRQLLVSKVLALGTAGLLQVLVWLISAPLLLNLASTTLGGFMSRIQIPDNFLVLGIIYFILGYLLFAVLSIGVGAISSNAMEGGQLSMLYTLACYIPLWLVGIFINFPNSPLWIVLSIFPITAPIQTMLRLGVSDIPPWQLTASMGLLVISIVVGLFLAIKIFRVYMLMYGKRPGLKEIINSLKKA
ncbi:MAG: ABC transporter permease [Spirochaetota bacterium]|nr:MAG: ABC transporter permease [Spirochaetota bacterium]